MSGESVKLECLTTILILSVATKQKALTEIEYIGFSTRYSPRPLHLLQKNVDLFGHGICQINMWFTNCSVF